MRTRYNYEIDPNFAFLKSFVASLPDAFDSFGEVIYKGRNTLRRGNIEGVDFAVKAFKPPHIINRVAYTFFRPSKAERSYRYSYVLLEKGISTPQPVAFLEEIRGGFLYRSYYVSLFSDYPRNLREFWVEPEIGNRASILTDYARFTTEMHNAGVLHLDYSSMNILFDCDGTETRFHVIDINRMRFGKVSEEEGYRNFSRLWLPEHTYNHIAEAYAEARGYDKKRAVERVRYYKDKYMSKKK